MARTLKSEIKWENYEPDEVNGSKNEFAEKKRINNFIKSKMDVEVEMKNLKETGETMYKIELDNAIDVDTE